MKSVLQQDLEWYQHELEAKEQDIFDLRAQIDVFSDGVSKLTKDTEDMKYTMDELRRTRDYERHNRSKMLKEDRDEISAVNRTLGDKLLKYVDLIDLYDNGSTDNETIKKLRKECGLAY